ncbi:MAG: Na-translocating system protein MpsC family protein [Nitrospirota bacterium]|nr:Na-translocating system protein MpsC family protein [Nitrospirota bacterium]
MMRNETLQQQEALEEAVRKAVCRFELEFMAGSFAERIRVLVAFDMIIVRSQGVLPAAEQQLARTEEGQALVKLLYRTLFTQQRHILLHEVAAVTGMEAIDVLTDFSLSTGEQVMVFLFASHHEN